MTSKERLLTVLKGKIPDHVPVSPDTSNMIPAKLTGRPFWDIYLYQIIPQWKAYINCVKHFGFDSLMDGYVHIGFEGLDEIDHEWKEVIVSKDDDRIVTQRYRTLKGDKEWSKTVNVYHRANSPNYNVNPLSVHLPLIPDKYEEIEGVVQYPSGEELLRMVKEEMGDHGLVGVWCGTSILIHNEEEIYDFYDNPDKYYNKRDALIAYYKKRFDKLMSLEHKPDFICMGGSGTLIFQTPQVFRELGLPIVQEISSLCKKHGIPSHVHSCGPAKALIKMLAEETDLTVVDPLEIAPMGDCDLKELKKLYGQRLVLKGNLHTTDIMLNGSTAEVVEACKRAIDAAAEGGRFILSTGDQCGRDTPEENIFAMIETAKSYGKY